METTKLTMGIITYTYSQNEISKMITEIIEKIEKWIKENNYQVSVNINQYKIIEKNWYHLSHSQMKKIQKYCYWLNKKISLKRVNTFFRLLSKLFDIERVKIKVSLKEEAIQNSRKKMLVARKLYEELLADYKAEKGNFYKK